MYKQYIEPDTNADSNGTTIHTIHEYLSSVLTTSSEDTIHPNIQHTNTIYYLRLYGILAMNCLVAQLLLSDLYFPSVVCIDVS